MTADRAARDELFERRKRRLLLHESQWEECGVKIWSFSDVDILCRLLEEAESERDDAIAQLLTQGLNPSELILNAMRRFWQGLLGREQKKVEHLIAERDRALRIVEALSGIADELIDICATFEQQMEKHGYVDTPGGLEHMGDVWRLLFKWRDALADYDADREGKST